MTTLTQVGTGWQEEQQEWEADVLLSEHCRNILEPLTRCPAVSSITWRRESGGSYAAASATWHDEPDYWRLRVQLRGGAALTGAGDTLGAAVAQVLAKLSAIVKAAGEAVPA